MRAGGVRPGLAAQSPDSLMQTEQALALFMNIHLVCFERVELFFDGKLKRGGPTVVSEEMVPHRDGD